MYLNLRRSGKFLLQIVIAAVNGNSLSASNWPTSNVKVSRKRKKKVVFGYKKKVAQKAK